jgi:predicted dehydrogenase
VWPFANNQKNFPRARAVEIFQLNGNRPTLYGDYRQLLDNTDVVAVIFATPDHWHCLQLIDAVDAGVSAYVAKPLANAIDECAQMIQASLARLGR